MQPHFYNLSLNNPLLSDVALESNKIFTNNEQIHSHPMQQPMLSSQQSSVEQQTQKINNRLSFLTRSSLSDDEPITPKSANKHVFQLDHHTHYLKKSDIQQQQQQQQQYRFYHTDLKIPFKHSDPSMPSQHRQDILFDNSKMNLRRRHNNSHGTTYESRHLLDIPTTTTATISAGTRVKDNNDDGDDDDLLPDDFEIVRANITGITRAMQAFHVRELFWDEANMKETKQNKHKRHHTAPDQHVARSAWTTTPTLIQSDTSKNNDSNFIAPHPHHRHPQPYIYLQTEQDLAIQQLVDDGKEHSTSLTTLSSSELAEKEVSIQPLWHPTDLSSDAPTHFYNNLPQQQRQSWMTMKCNEDDDNDIDSDIDQMGDNNSNNDDTWRRKFMALMASLVKQSEHLEYLSTELLSAESHVRSLLSLASTVQDQFYEREKQYQERLRECDVAGQQQAFMLASLDELMADLDMKTSKAPQAPQTPRPPPSSILLSPPTTTANISYEEPNQRSSSFSAPPPPPPSPPPTCPSQLQQQQLKQQRQPTSLVSKWYRHMWQGLETTLSSMENDTFVYKTRWRAGMFLGADVGTGDIIHVFHHPTDGIEMVMAGFGIIMAGSTLDQESSGCPIPSSTHDDKMILHQYQVHLLPKDRKTVFVLLPKNKWMPDLFVDQCQHHGQVDRCPTKFTLFQRKHHCRRCGKIVCQRHSGNRLPLFKADHVDQGKSCKWYRICDSCFILAISSVSSH